MPARRASPRRRQRDATRALVVEKVRDRARGNGGSFRKRGPGGSLVVGEFATTGAVIHDPAVSFAYELRRRLRPSQDTMPSVCRRIDPATGAVVATADPISRKWTPA